MHIGVFDVLNKVLFQKLTGDSFKNTIFLQVFKVFLHLLSKPLFSCVGLSFSWFLISVFFCLVFLVVVIRQIRLLCSGFCFCCFGFPWFFVVCVLFLFVFGLFCFLWRV